MGLFGNSYGTRRKKSPAQQAAKLERKIAAKKKKLEAKARLEKARKDWAKMQGR
jgi:hypothetical protein